MAPQGVPGPARPSSKTPWVAKHLHEGILDAYSTSTGSSLYGGAAVLLWAPRSKPKAGPNQPAEKTHFSRLYLWPHSLVIRCSLVLKAHDRRSRCRSTGKSRTSLFTPIDCLSVCITTRGLVWQTLCTLQHPAEGKDPLFHGQDENHNVTPESGIGWWSGSTSNTLAETSPTEEGHRRGVTPPSWRS